MKSTGVIIEISTTAQSRVFVLPFSPVLLLSWPGDIISESETRARSWDQKAQNEVCLLSAAHTVRHEKGTNTQTTRRTSHTNHQQAIFERQKKRRRGENKYVISRRLGLRRRIS